MSGGFGARRGAGGQRAGGDEGAAGNGACAAVAVPPGGDAQAAAAAAGFHDGTAGIAQAQVPGETGFFRAVRGIGGGGLADPGLEEGFELGEEEEQEGGHTSGVCFQGSAEAGERGRRCGRGGVHVVYITDLC